MIVLALVGVAMVGTALAWVLLRGSPDQAIDHDAANVAILRDQLAELDAEAARGAIDHAHHEHARSELERRVLEELGPEPHAAATLPHPAWGIVALIPVATLLLYLLLGEPGALGDAEPHASDDAMGGVVAKLAARLEREPDDAKGWLTLARSYAVLRRYDAAAQAYEHAARLFPGDAAVLADFADTLATAQGGSLAGRPIELVRAALAIDPNHWKALALAGTEAFARKRYGEAIGFWERVHAPPDSSIAQSIGASIAEARALAGHAAPPRIAGTVTLAERLRGAADPAATVFVFARAAEGPRMPLAILKTTVRDLPFDFALDDSMAMTPERTLASAGTLVVVARISKSGNASATAGDLEGVSRAVTLGAQGVAVVVDRELP